MNFITCDERMRAARVFARRTLAREAGWSSGDDDLSRALLFAFTLNQ
jgi:hypothetical protein